MRRLALHPKPRPTLSAQILNQYESVAWFDYRYGTRVLTASGRVIEVPVFGVQKRKYGWKNQVQWLYGECRAEVEGDEYWMDILDAMQPFIEKVENKHWMNVDGNIERMAFLLFDGAVYLDRPRAGVPR